MYGFISLSKMDRVYIILAGCHGDSNCIYSIFKLSDTFSQYFTNLLKNWQLALRKLPICVLTKIHKNVHGRAHAFSPDCVARKTSYKLECREENGIKGWSGFPKRNKTKHLPLHQLERKG